MPRARSSDPSPAAVTGTAVTGTAVTGPGRTRDERLRLARRLDWRFLLPSPILGRAAIVGAPDDLLPAALAAMADHDAVTLLPSPTADGVSAHDAFDTVVLTGHLGRSDLQVAAGAVGPGGCLVVEVEGVVSRRLLGRGVGRPATAIRVARSLAGAGFVVRSWLAWPAIGRATTFAALDDEVAMRWLVGRRLGDGAGSAVAAVAGRLAGTWLLPALAPAVILVARRGEIGPSVLERHVAPAASREPGAPVDSASSSPRGLIVLTPRYRASAHVVCLAITADGAPARVAKAARLRDDDSLAHEAAVLAALAQTSVIDEVGPTLLHSPARSGGPGDDAWPILVESGMEGVPLSPPTVRADRARAVDGIEAWLAGLPIEEFGQRRVAVAARLDSALDSVERLAERSPSGRLLQSLVTRTRPLAGMLAQTTLPRVFEHGDPAHPNLLRRPDGRVVAVDWERGEPDGLPLHDLTIALAYIAAAAAGATSAPDQAAAFRAAMTGDDPWAARALDRAIDRAGCPTTLRPALVVAAWARTAAWLAVEMSARPNENATDSAIEPSASTDDVGRWLVDDRSVALWDVSLDLASAR